jgi:uncharacterized lipoprotein YddW (UPF0748 family)
MRDRHRGRCRAITHALAAVIASVVIALSFAATQAAATTPEEVRALWVTRATLASPATVAEMVRAADASGFNTLVVQVRGRGDAYYRSTLEPRPTELVIRPDFDPLAEVLALAKPAGIKVHAWINVNLVSSAADLPASRQHVIYRHPEWLMVPRDLAEDMRSTDPRSPEYLGRLARWTRANLETVEGLYTSPLHAEAAAHVASIASDIARRYPVDGIHLDYLRFPNADFDYSPAAVQQFTALLRPQLTVPERERLDERDALDSLAYPNMFPERWQTFRRSRMTGLLMRVRTAVKAINDRVVISAAVQPDVEVAATSRMQDWRTWLDQGLIDVLCPMAYTPDVELFGRQIAAARTFAGERPVWAGVAAYRLSPTATLQHIDVARRRQAAGIILFSYDALVTPPNSVTSLAALARAAFGAGSH